jgi:hypothetical protein
MTAVAALDPRQPAYAIHELVRARRRVAGLAGPLAYETHRLEIVATAEELAKQLCFLGSRLRHRRAPAADLRTSYRRLV